MATLSALARWTACAAALGAPALGVGAQDAANDAALEVTIRLLPENAAGRPDEITRRIELPPAVRPDSPANSAPDRRGAGQDTAAEARERGREFGQEIAEQARQNRENAGRPDRTGPPDNAGPPDDVPGPQGPPDNVPGPQGPPDNVPGPPITPPGQL